MYKDANPVKAKNFTTKNSCSQPLHIEPVNYLDPDLDNGTDLGTISNINQLAEASGNPSRLGISEAIRDIPRDHQYHPLLPEI